MRHALFILLLFLCTPLRAEMTIETIELHYRSADDVIHILQPMVAPGGSLTGSGYKLFIKSTPENIAQLRKMLADIDMAPVQLLVSVSLDSIVLQENAQGSARITVQGSSTLHAGDKSTHDNSDQSNSRIKYDVHMFERARTQRKPQVQQVRVSEGLWATIKTGQAIPVATSTRNPDGTVTETYTYTAVASGFQVLPRVHGDTVTLMIRPQAQSPSASGGGAYDTTEMDTTVTGKLGQWIALGSVNEKTRGNAAGIAYSTAQRSDTSNQIFVKVERIAQ
jgi:type II secretory pathway component GspD/PulD (secretin)